jgi:stage II sporulation protein D
VIFIKKFFLVIFILLPISISSFRFKGTAFFYNDEENSNSNDNVIVHIKDRDLYLDLEDYIFGVVSAEMPALFNDEALKAQAVASRSFAMSKAVNNIIEISSTISDQVYYDNYELKEKWEDNYGEYSNKIRNAVVETKNLVVKRDNKILKTYYFAMSNGQTENSVAVFNDMSFSSVLSPYENDSLKNFTVVSEFSVEEMCKSLSLQSIEIGEISRNETNRVESIIVSGKSFTGVEFRKLLNLRSTDFEIEEDNNKFLITTRGYGHGVGMSQYGANEMAKNGYSYDEIINYYYQNIELLEI